MEIHANEEAHITPVSGDAPTHRLRVTLPFAGVGNDRTATIESALRQTDGVLLAYVNGEMQMAYVEYDPKRTDAESLISVIESAGDAATAEGS